MNNQTTMEYRTSVLASDQVKLIKQINVVPPNGPKAATTIGLVLYERRLHLGYKIAEKTQEGHSSLLIPYPNQQDYPADSLDELILESVRVDYPSSYVYNELLFTTADVERLGNLTSRPADKADLVVCPSLTAEDWNRLAAKEVLCFRKEVNIYAHFSPKHIKNIAFRGRCNFVNHEAIFRNLDTVKFL